MHYLRPAFTPSAGCVGGVGGNPALSARSICLAIISGVSSGPELSGAKLVPPQLPASAETGASNPYQGPVGDLLAVPTEITAAHTKGQDLAAYGLDQPCNLVVGDGVEIAEPGEFAVTGVNARHGRGVGPRVQ